MELSSPALIPHEHHGLRWHAFAALADLPDVVAAVSARQGGVSRGSLATLNLSYAVGDDPGSVAENRRRFSTAVGIDEASIVCAEQVHGGQVACVDETCVGAGYRRRATALPGIDGMVTDRRGVALWLGFADCVPILAYDPVRRAIGIAHAGWRGTLGRIAVTLIETMRERFGGEPADLRVAIGPSIGPCCYTVGPDVVAAFERDWTSTEGLFRALADGTRQLNLWEANRCLVATAGVPVSQISVAGACTACHVDEFFSHRAQRGRAGRIAAVIALGAGR